MIFKKKSQHGHTSRTPKTEKRDRDVKRSTQEKQTSKITCFKCGKVGHKASDCRDPDTRLRKGVNAVTTTTDEKEAEKGDGKDSDDSASDTEPESSCSEEYTDSEEDCDEAPYNGCITGGGIITSLTNDVGAVHAITADSITTKVQLMAPSQPGAELNKHRWIPALALKDTGCYDNSADSQQNAPGITNFMSTNKLQELERFGPIEKTAVRKKFRTAGKSKIRAKIGRAHV